MPALLDETKRGADFAGGAACDKRNASSSFVVPRSKTLGDIVGYGQRGPFQLVPQAPAADPDLPLRHVIDPFGQRIASCQAGMSSNRKYVIACAPQYRRKILIMFC